MIKKLELFNLKLCIDFTDTRFPLENKHVFQKLFNNIGSSNWQPLKTDQICSDHLKNDFIVDNSNDLELNKYAVPLITPKVCYTMHFC